MKSSVFTVFKSPKIYASRASNIKLVLKFLAFYDAKKELLKNTRLVCRANQNKSYGKNQTCHRAHFCKFESVKLCEANKLN